MLRLVIVCVCLLSMSVALGKPGSQPVPVVLAPVVVETIQRELTVLATFKASEQVALKFPVTDIVQSLYFEHGETVRKGELLVRLRRDEEQALYEQANWRLQQAEREVQRLKGLVKSKLASQQDLDQQQDALALAKADVAQARAALLDRELRAPFSGLLGLRLISVGSLLSPTDTVALLQKVTPIEAYVPIPQADLAWVQNGMPVFARVDTWQAETFRGEIRAFSGEVDTQSRQLQALAEFANADARLKPGMRAQVRIPLLSREALLIPQEAVLQRGAKAQVYVVDAENSAQPRKVVLGMRQGELVEVLQGLEASEQVVTDGLLRLKPNAAVKIQGVSHVAE